MLEIADDIIEVQQETKLDDKDHKWCVYMHISPSEKIYIGITGQKPEYRWKKNGLGYKTQTYFYRAIQKYGWGNFQHKIICEHLTHELACKIEQQLIAHYNTKDPRYGYNLTDGGEGSYGRPMSDKQKEILSKARTEKLSGTNNPNYGRPRTDLTKQRISDALKGLNVGKDNPNYGNHKLAGENNPMFGVHRYGEAAPMYGKHHTEETKEKISKARKGKLTGENHPMYGKTPSDFCKQRSREANSGYKNWHSRTIYSIELDRLFWGAKEISDEFGFDSSSILKCCKWKKKSCGRHPETQNRMHWIYAYDYVQTDGTIIQGAISLGYITEDRVNEYLNNLKIKEIDINDIMEEE